MSLSPLLIRFAVRIARYRRSVAEYEEPQETLAIVSPRNFIAHRIDLMLSLPEKLFPSREDELQQASLDRDERTDWQLLDSNASLRDQATYEAIRRIPSNENLKNNIT